MDFISDFISNVLATLIGVGIGVPIAFSIERKNQADREKGKKREEQSRVDKILSLLRLELQSNKHILSQIHVDVRQYYTPPKVESWRAFSDGGELQWINDPGLLNSIAVAYHYIESILFLYQKYYEQFYFHSTMYHDGPDRTLSNFIFVTLQTEIQKATGAIDNALLDITNCATTPQ